MRLEQARTPHNHRVYVVGDIHGRADLLLKLLEMIAADAAETAKEKVLIYLGDFIDRGPQSRDVVETVRKGPLAGFRQFALRGNHEEAMLSFLDDPIDGAGWLQYGGMETLMSYGVTVHAGVPSPDRLQAAANALREALPAEHLGFLSELYDFFVLGDYMFVHAGINPRRPLDRQRPHDLRWIRDPFIGYTGLYDKVIVHGHTITEKSEFRQNRIGIDTGAYFSGVLTCLVLEEDMKRLLQTNAADGNG